MHTPEEVLQIILENVVEFQEDIRIEKTTDEMGVLLSVYVNTADMGKIIGKQGKTANALREIMHILGGRAHQKISMKIYDPR